MSDPSEEDLTLNASLKAAAEKKIGGDAVTSKFGIDCFGLVDALLRSVDANSAHDYRDEVPITATAHYKWGDGILLDSIVPGDIIQFRNHVIQTTTLTLVGNKWHETESRTQRRPHHTAIVLEVRNDGSVRVVEQNVYPSPKKVMSNVIPRLAEGEETKTAGNKKTTIKVTGVVSAYRPVPRPKKDASLHRTEPTHTGGRPARAGFIPAHGGPKRSVGPIGMG